MRINSINPLRILVMALISGLAIPLSGQELDLDKELTEDQIEAWFNDDAEERALAVNEGELVFLPKIPDKVIYHSHNRLKIDRNSLSSGWVGLKQCHQHLDAVPDSQIVYRYQRMMNLRVETTKGIERAWIEGNSVQLKNITQGAELCISADVGIFYILPNNEFVLKNGPFHRKFLDGYYPMQVTLDIHFPDNLIIVKSVVPENQSGFNVKKTNGNLNISSFFEGELSIQIYFRSIK